MAQGDFTLRIEARVTVPRVGLRQRIHIWRIRRRIAELKDATDIGLEMIRNDQALIERQQREIAQLECELVALGGLTTCAK